MNHNPDSADHLERPPNPINHFGIYIYIYCYRTPIYLSLHTLLTLYDEDMWIVWLPGVANLGLVE